jgi:tetratricopeptide (TPR) repeat protein
MALRYCGLLEASAAAHEQARQLDPHISTSASHTYWMLGRYEEALATVDRDRDFGDEAFVLASIGRMDEAVATLADRRRRFTASGQRSGSPAFQLLEGFEAVMLGNAELAVARLALLSDFPDPEGVFFLARCLAHLGRKESALDNLEKSVRNGFFCTPVFVRDAWLDPIRTDPRFLAILRESQEKMNEAMRAFHAHAGSRVLTVGMRAPA